MRRVPQRLGLATPAKTALLTLLLALLAAGCSASHVVVDAGDARSPTSPLPEGWEVFEEFFARSTRGCERCALGLDEATERTRDAVRAGRLGVDVARMRDCMDNTHLDGSGNALRDWGYGTCPGALVPRLPLGAACDAGLECVDGFCLRDDYRRTASGSYVAVGCGVCAPLRSEGEACGFTMWADVSLVCARGLRCFSSTCVSAPAPIGLPCTAPDDCQESLECRGGFCDLPRCSGRCGASYGGSCVNHTDCVAPLDCVFGRRGRRCARTAIAGETCVAPDVCAAGSECVDSVCIPFPSIGEACRERCARGACVDSRCVADETGIPEAGEPCSPRPAEPGSGCAPSAVCIDHVCRAVCRLGSGL